VVLGAKETRPGSSQVSRLCPGPAHFFFLGWLVQFRLWLLEMGLFPFNPVLQNLISPSFATFFGVNPAFPGTKRCLKHLRTRIDATWPAKSRAFSAERQTDGLMDRRQIDG